MTRTTISVALVEDDPAIRQMVAERLASANGFVCVGEFARVNAAIAGLPALKPHVVLVDINLAGQSGIDCIRTLKPSMPETEFLVVTVYDDTARVFEALTAGASGYLLKRASSDEMLAAIRQVHEGGSPMSGHIARKVVTWFHRCAPPPRNPTESLTQRESEVLRLLAQGHAYKEIADTLSISMGTVNTHVRRIYSKLHVQSRTQAVAAVNQPNVLRPADA
jgi:DNA-binding NarL/FixJ family response regulator